ncbi:MAG TPA: hypothetical protein VFU86_07800 [Terriglobales bacterium]|nr:hypothetical protein [Terriglobales bacterium]
MVPLRSALSAIFRQPGILVAEIAWRWSFGASALGILALGAIRLAHAIAIYPEEHQMLTSRSPILIAQAILEISHRAWPPIAHLGIIVIPVLVALWTIAATLGRGYVLGRMKSAEPAKSRWLALLALNLLRVVSVVFLVVAYFGCSFATALVSHPDSPNYPLAILTFLSLFITAFAAWSLLHWVISTACIYAARKNAGVLASLGATMQLMRSKSRDLFSIAAQNSSVRTVVAFLFTLLALPPFLIHNYTALFWTVEVSLFLAYCIASDLLLLARLAAYVDVTEALAEAFATEHA